MISQINIYDPIYICNKYNNFNIKIGPVRIRLIKLICDNFYI